MSYYQKQKGQRLSIGHDGNALTVLIAIHLTAFMLIALMNVIYLATESENASSVFTRNFFQWITLPASFETFLTRPWTLISHMFAHSVFDVWQILGNLLWLWAFGYLVQDLAGNRKIIPLFLYGALAGAVAFMLAVNFIPSFRSHLSTDYMFGASAGIMALAIGATTLSPNYRILPMLNGGIPIWIITVVYLIIDLATIPKDEPGLYVAHLTAGVIGFLFMSFLQKGYDWSIWMNNVYDWTNDLFNPDRPQKDKGIKSQLFYKSKVQPFTRTPTLTQQRVDEILDKIHQKGYSALTEDEKDLLKRAAREDI